MKRLASSVKIGLLAVAVIALALAASADRSRAYPSFSIGNPSISAAPGDVLDPPGGVPLLGPTPPPAVATVISAAALGVPGGNIDGLSYGDDFPWGVMGVPHFYEFSVDNAATGGLWLPPGPDNVRTQGIFGEGAAGPDVFVTTAGLGTGPSCTPGMNFNTLLYDGDGFTALAGPVLGVGGLSDLPVNPALDNIDAYEARDVSAVDYLTAGSPVPPLPQPADGIPDGAVFFTVDPATATALGVSAADILVTDPGSATGWTIYAPAGILGLTPGDDIDALMVADSISIAPGPGGASPPPRTFGPHPLDVVAFSLAPGSPSLATLPLVCPSIPGPNSPGDVWWVSPFFTLGPAPLVAAEDLGLCTLRSCGPGLDDNLDGIDISWGPGGDVDNDGLPDGIEGACGAVVGVPDTDGDGILDGIEAAMSNSPPGPCTAWPSPANPDSDGDGLYDGWEMAWWTVGCMSTNPSVADAGADTDGDGISNIWEQRLGTSPCRADPFPAPETPSFSLSAVAPVSAPPDAILRLNPVVGGPPLVAIPGFGLGLGFFPGPDDLSNLSYGMEYPISDASEWWLRFSMAPDFMWPPDGLFGTDVFLESTCVGWPGQAIGDEFDVSFPLPPPFLGLGTNTQVLDETGLQDAPGCAAPPGYPVGTVLPAGGAPLDDMDALEERPPSFVDDGSGGGVAGDGIPDRPVFFTLAPGSTTLLFMGYTAADILWSRGGLLPMMYAPAGALGLIPGADVIDALMLYDNGNQVFDSGDWVWLSLAPGSPTLGFIGANESDVLFVDGAAPGAILIQYFADQLGLNSPFVPGPSPLDDLDALKGEIPCLTGPNSDAAIGNGKGVLGNDGTVPNGEVPSAIDCSDGDDDNDGYADDLELVLPDPSCPAKTALTSPGGDITYDDNNNGDPALGSLGGTDAADDPASWDTDGDAVLDGAECALGTDPANRASRPSTAACGGTGDTDTDGLADAWETCKWGTSPAMINTDGDLRGDCVEAADVDGNGIVNFTGDVIYYAKAIQLPPASFGRDGDFDIDGNNALNFTGDVIQEAKFGQIAGLCK